MRKTFYTMTFALMALVPLSLQAQDWTAPTLETEALTSGETQYLYNVKAEAFLYNNSSDYEELASEGTPFKVTLRSDGTYTFCYEAEGTYLYYTSGQARVGDAEVYDCNWTVTEQSDGTYLIRPDEANEDYGSDFWPDCYMGWNGVDGDVIVYSLLDYSSSYGLSWAAVAEDAHNTYVAYKALYDALITSLDYSEVDVSEYSALYNEGTASAEEIAAAAEELESTLKYYTIYQATLDNPADASFLLTNYSFDEDFVSGGYDITGWTQSPTYSFYYTDDDMNGDTEGIGRWAWGDEAFSDAVIYQTLTDAPIGKYTIETYYTCIDQDLDDGETEYAAEGNTLYVTTALGNYTGTLASTTRWGCDALSFDFFVTDGNMEVGIEMSGSTANWFRMAYIHLTYYGEDAVASELEALIAEGEAVEGDMNSAYRTALDEAIAAAKVLVAAEEADVEVMLEMMSTLTEAINAAEENVAAYLSLAEMMEEAEAIYADLIGETTDEVGALADYLMELNDLDIFSSLPYTTEEVLAIVDELDLLAQSAQHSLIEEGDDVTEFLTNADFSTSSCSGWDFNTGDASSFNYYANDNVESFWTPFDISQTLRGMPSGTYEVTVQGFQRVGWFGDSEDNEDYRWVYEQESLLADITAELYLNSLSVGFKDVMDCEGNTLETGWSSTVAGYYVPNGMYDGQQFFEAGYFVNTLEGFVYDGTLTIGLRNESGTGWVMFDNVTLTYKGADVEAALEMLQTQYDATVPYLDEVMNADIMAAITAACITAEELLDDDANPSFDDVLAAYAALVASLEGADESIEACDAFVHADTICARDLAYSGVTDTEAGAELSSLYATYHAQVEAGAITLTTDEINEAIAQYRSLAMEAKIASGVSAGADLTYILSNNSYEDQWNLGDGVSGVYNAPYGWTFLIDSVVCTTAEEMYEAGLNNYFSPDSNCDCTDGGSYGYCMQTGGFPDVYMYQQVVGLPAGTYKVTVEMVVPNDDENYRLAGQRLYVNNAAMYYGHEYEYDLDLLEEYHPYEVARTFGECDEIDSQNNPYGLGDAGPLSTLDVTVEIATGDTLTLGVRTDGIWEYTYKTAAVSGWDNFGWCKIDNMRLYCVSLTDLTAIESVEQADDAANVLSEEFFTADGMRIGALRQGVNIVRQKLSDGTTVTKKVLVR